MIIFDTHTHLAGEEFAGDVEQVIENMTGAGVALALVVGDPAEGISALDMAHRYPFLFAASGVHPHNASKYSDDMEQRLLRELADDKCVCLGEIGLDYHYDLSPREAQREVFARQLVIAREKGLPAQLHIREAHGEAIDILRGMRNELPQLILHCCTASRESCEIYLNMGAYISLSGAVTFKNAPKLREVAAFVPADRLLVETDCPYMSPVPKRGTRNEPANTVYTVRAIADARGEDEEKVALACYNNGRRVFGIEGFGV